MHNLLSSDVYILLTKQFSFALLIEIEIEKGTFKRLPCPFTFFLGKSLNRFIKV